MGDGIWKIIQDDVKRENNIVNPHKACYNEGKADILRNAMVLFLKGENYGITATESIYGRGVL